jgi:inorganic pyrophosphatase
MRSLLFSLFLLLGIGMATSTLFASNSADTETTASTVTFANGLTQIDPYTLKSPVHFVDGINPVAGKDLVRAVVEIPTGTTAKWEVDKSDGNLKWEFKKGSPRVVKYLGYPGNYGMIPGTLLAEENGGDGDPLDVLILGTALPRGSVVEVRIIGLLNMLDKGKQDDKLIAVMNGDVFDGVDTIKQLNKEFPGVSAIIESWFSNYKGQKKIETRGYSGRKEARRVLDEALADYKSATLAAELRQH